MYGQVLDENTKKNLKNGFLGLKTGFLLFEISSPSKQGTLKLYDCEHQTVRFYRN